MAARKLVLRKIEGFIKGVFARFRPPQPPVVIRRRKSGGWEAESFLAAEVVGYTPPTQSSLCTRGSSLAAFTCLRSKPAFTGNKKVDRVEQSVLAVVDMNKIVDLFYK